MNIVVLIVVLVVLIVAAASIVFVWQSVRGSTLSDGTPGSAMDAGEDVRRIDMGPHVYAAQRAHGQLNDSGVETRIVSLDRGTFGLGLGQHHYLVYGADDEAAVRTVVDRLLDDVGNPIEE